MRLLKPAWVAQDDLPIFSIDIHPNGAKFATGGQGDDCGRVTVWNMAPILSPKAQKDSSVPKMLCQMDNHLACVNCVRWSSNGKYLASAGDDKLVMLWQLSAYGGGAVFGGGGKVNHESYRCAHTLRLHSGDVLDIAWSPDDTWLATASVDNTVIVWDVEKLPQTVAILKGHTGLVKGVTWDPVGKYLASQSDDKTLRVWRTTDWGLEAVVTEPFEECGGTTHVLRLNWSPDGQYLVSAHAMNGGGPTAQILDREGWKFEKDFVGHRKAITCVRFNDNIFEKYRNDVGGDCGKQVQYVCLAIGSRDRSLSVWLTALKRPLFVVHDVFDSSILDLSWSKDGFVLIACSMDGSVAAVVMDKTELGTPMTTDAKNSLLKKLYGQSVGSMKQKPLLIEDPALLRVKENGDSLSPLTNGHHKTMDSIMPVKGPLDKQIEVRTTDGRRRITPMYLPPIIENGVDSQSQSSSFGKKMESSSSASKSKIKVERLDGVVDPNVSPGKNGTPTKPIIESHSQSSMPATFVAASTATPTVLKPNMIAIKRKPGNALATAATTTTDSSDSQAKPSVIKPKSTIDKKKKTDDDDDEKLKPVKKKNGVIESSSSESGDSSSDDSSGSSDDESASRTSKSDKSDHDKKSKVNGHDERPKDAVSIPPKANVIAIKRKADDSPTSQPSVKKRGRPPKSSNPSTGTSTPVLSDRMTAPAPVTTLPPLAPVTPTHTTVLPASRPMSPGLPPLSLPNQRHIFNVKINTCIQPIQVHNNIHRSSAGSVHRVYVEEGKGDDAVLKWGIMLPSPVVSIKGGGAMVIIACKDGTIHILSSSGTRLLPPMILPAPPSVFSVNNHLLACITTSSRLFLWRLPPRPRIILEDKPVSPLHNHISPRTLKSISALSFTPDDAPLLSLSDGSSWTISTEMGMWVQLVSPRSDLSNQPPSDLPHHPSSSLPLASITPRPIASPRIQPNVAAACSGSAIESRLSSSKYLSSPAEFHYWLGCKVRYLTSQGQEAQLRTLLEDLMGPPSWNKQRGRPAHCNAMDTGEGSGTEVVDNGNDWEDKVLGISKRKLLEEMLPLVASNLSLQRLYSEFRKQLDHIQSDSIDLFK